VFQSLVVAKEAKTTTPVKRRTAQRKTRTMKRAMTKMAQRLEK
jgi:hypothetical protein